MAPLRACLVWQVRLMVHLRHPNITSVVGACFEGSTPILVMELMERGRRASDSSRLGRLSSLAENSPEYSPG